MARSIYLPGVRLVVAAGFGTVLLISSPGASNAQTVSSERAFINLIPAPDRFPGGLAVSYRGSFKPATYSAIDPERALLGRRVGNDDSQIELEANASGRGARPIDGEEALLGQGRQI